LRDKSGWQITEAGRALLASIEASVQKIIPEEPGGTVVLLVRPPAAPPPIQRGNEASPGASPPDGRRQRPAQ
jgi:hypothetical protein